MGCYLVVYTIQKNKLENLRFNNYSGNTGFLLWLSSYCITCIFHQTVRAKYMFSLLTFEDTCEPAIQQIKISGLPSLVQAISNIVTRKLKTDIVHYEIQFLSCTSNMDLHQIKHIMQKHTRKYSYDNLEPAPKKKRLQQISSKNKICSASKTSKVGAFMIPFRVLSKNNMRGDNVVF